MTVTLDFHTAGRVEQVDDGFVRYGWPGIYFEGRFHGAGVGIVLDDSENDYDIQIDGATAATLVPPGRTTSWIEGLSPGEHSVRFVKRTESPSAAGRFGGYAASPGGAVLPEPRARSRQIEFIGDSYTAGYGDVSMVRDCSSNGGVNRNSNADLAFGALTARCLGADYQINAYSGRGMVRNYNGSSPGTDYRTYYERALLNVDRDIWRKPLTWQPQVVVIGLGINDFSTPSTREKPGPRRTSWSPPTRGAHHGILNRLCARYRRGTFIVVSSTYLYNTTVFVETALRIVQARNRRGDGRVRHWYYDGPGLDYLGCDWHPSSHDHRIIASLLETTWPIRHCAGSEGDDRRLRNVAASPRAAGQRRPALGACRSSGCLDRVTRGARRPGSPCQCLTRAAR